MRLKIRFLTFGALLITLILPATIHGEILFQHSFEDSSEEWLDQGTHSTTTFSWIVNKPTISDMNSYSGNNSSKFVVDIGNSDPCTDDTNPSCYEKLRRSMLMLLEHPEDSKKEFWYGFTVFVPSDWNFDSEDSSIVVWQTKSYGDDGQTPQLALYLTGNSYVLRNNAGNHIETIAPVERGTWTNFVLNVRYRTTSEGFIRAYVNNTLRLNISGKTQRTEELKQLSFGIYKWRWQYAQWRQNSRDNGITSRTLYIDDIRIGNHTSSLDEINNTIPPKASPAPNNPVANPYNTPIPQPRLALDNSFSISYGTTDSIYDLNNDGIVNFADILN